MNGFSRYAKIMVAAGLFVACTEAASEGVSSEDAIATAPEEKSVVIVEGGAHACPAAALPGDYVLAPRACLEESACAEIRASDLRISAMSNLGQAGALEVYVSEVTPVARGTKCSEFVVLHLTAPLQAGIQTKVRDPGSPMRVGDAVRLVSVEGTTEAVDASVDAARDAHDPPTPRDAASEASDDSAAADAGDAGDAGAILQGLAAPESSHAKKKVTIAQVKSTTVDDSTRHFDTTPQPSGFVIALDEHSRVVGLGSAKSVIEELTTMRNFDEVISLYPQPDVLLSAPDVITPTNPPVTGGPPSHAGGAEPSQSSTSLAPVAVRSESGCSVSGGTGGNEQRNGSGVFGLAVTILALTVAFRRRQIR